VCVCVCVCNTYTTNRVMGKCAHDNNWHHPVLAALKLNYPLHLSVVARVI